MRLIDIRHPTYVRDMQRWTLWRHIMQGGTVFVQNHLKKLERETVSDYSSRMDMTPCAGHAKTCILDVRNAISARLPSVRRIDPTDTYSKMVMGRSGGVNGEGATMDYFITEQILPELLAMGRVGVFVDRAADVGTTRNYDTVLPYCYIYRVEDILSWAYTGTQLTSLLLRHQEPKLENGLVVDNVTTYRHFTLTNNGVDVATYREDGTAGGAITLTLDTIPFIMPTLSSSLLNDIDRYQVAVTNMNSWDIAYAIRGNFPYFVEQYDGRTMPAGMKPGAFDPVDQTGEADKAQKASDPEVIAGISTGRRYPLGTNAPQFIHPSSEPLRVSMDKQAVLIKDIHLLIRATLENLERQRESADSKYANDRQMQNGLSVIGEELRTTELAISSIANKYIGVEDTITIKYPADYSMMTEEDAQREAERLTKLRDSTPSITYKREVCKKLVDVVLGRTLDVETLAMIKNEIDSAIVIDNTTENVREMLESAVMGNNLGAKVLGLPDGEAERAAEDHANRLARIAIAQTEGAAAALKDGQDVNAARDQKRLSRQTDDQSSTKSRVRGDGK